MRPVNEVVVLIAGVVPVAVDEAVVRAGAGPVPCGQVWLSAKSWHSVAQDLHLMLNICLTGFVLRA